jgi:hypothetical protein
MIFNPAMIDCARSSLTSLLYLCCLVDGMGYTYSPNNPTVGQTLTVTWVKGISEPASFRLGLVNDDLGTDPQQIQDVEADKGQTIGTVAFTLTISGYIHHFHSAFLTLDELLLAHREL